MVSGLLAVLGACHSVSEPVVEPPWTAADASAPLTHADCIRLACAFGPARSSWRARHDAAAARLRQAGLLPNPALLLEWEDFQLFESVPAAALQQTFSLSLAISDLLLRGSRQEIAEREMAATLAELQTERRQLAIEVCRAYDQLVAARRTAELADADAAAAARFRAAMKRMAEAGLAAPIAATQADIEADEAAADAAAAGREASALELAFAFALGFERPVPLQLADPIDCAPPPTMELETLLAEAAAARPELAALRCRYEAELERLRLTASPLRFLPVVGAGYRRLEGNQLGVGSIDVALPVFDAGGAEVAAADAALLAAAAALQQGAHAVARDVCLAVQATAAATEHLDRAARPIAARRQALADAAERWFAAGEISFAERREPIRAAERARRELVAAELAVAESSWPLRIGSLLAVLPVTGD